MKKMKVYLFFLSILFISCIHIVVNMDNVCSSLDREEYNKSDEIKLNLYGEFLPEENVVGGVVYISLRKGDTETAQFKVLTTNDLKELSDNDYSDDFRCLINPEKNEKYITKFNKQLTINVKESGEYVFSILFIISSSKQLQDVSKIINIPFTVIE